MDIDPQLISYIATIILGLVATFFGEKWVKGKAVSMKFAIGINTLTEAIVDDRITQEEAERIVEAWQGVIEEAKGIAGTKQVTPKPTKVTPITRLDAVEEKVKKIDDIDKKIDMLLAK